MPHLLKDNKQLNAILANSEPEPRKNGQPAIALGGWDKVLKKPWGDGSLRLFVMVKRDVEW